jgi:tripartite-type tricarboxylate transporter receptor subunit TctC
LKVPQTTGGQFFSLKPNADISFYNEFSEIMKKVMSSPDVKEKLLSINFFPEYVHGEQQTKK